MLKYRNAELVLGALFATALWAGIWGWHDSYTLTEKQKDECYETAKRTGQKSDECKTFWERTTSDPVAVFTLVLAVSTVGLWVATIFLYRAGEKQIAVVKTSADAAKDSAETAIAAERAYIFPGYETLVFSASGHVTIPLVMTNAGRMPGGVKEVGFVFLDRTALPPTRQGIDWTWTAIPYDWIIQPRDRKGIREITSP